MSRKAKSKRGKRVTDVENRLFTESEEPAVVFHFKNDNNFKVKRERCIESLRDVGFLVGEITTKENIFVKVSVPAPLMMRQAEATQVKLRLKEVHGGALHEYSDAQRELFALCSEETLLSSAQQLKIIDDLIKAPKSNRGAEIKIEELKQSKVLAEYFFLHYEPARKKLEDEWAYAWTKKQPLELVREYFGEKVSLYFCWLGHYTTMLWVPAITGIVMTISQLYTSIKTGSMDNPWVPLFCCALALWAVAFLETWKQIEETKKIEWCTGEFESNEEARPEFKPTDKKRNRLNGETEMYFPAWKRNLYVMLSVAVVFVFICVVVAVVICLMVAKYALTEWFGKVGAALGSALNAASIMTFNMIYGMVVGHLNDLENWRTETEHEDALIAKNFCFMFVNSYFVLFFVAYIQNHFVLFGFDLHCPDYECMPVLTMTLGIVFGTQIFVQQAMEIGMPLLMGRFKKQIEMITSCSCFGGKGDDDEAQDGEKKEGEQEAEPSVVEQQSEMEEYEGVFEDYNEMVVQFGYVTLFAAAFPPAATLALINNVIEIRIDAMKMVTATKRSEYKVAADIGTWMTILEVLTVVAIMTNVTIVGFTSTGLYYYFPEITPLQKIWVAVIAEHLLFGLKLGIEIALSGPPETALNAAKAQEHFKEKALKTWARKHDLPAQAEAGGGGGGQREDRDLR